MAGLRRGFDVEVYEQAPELKEVGAGLQLSANGTKLKPRAEMAPGTAVELQLQPPDGHPVNVAGLVWRLDTDGMAVMFLRNIPVQFTTSGTRPENGRRGWR